MNKFILPTKQQNNLTFAQCVPDECAAAATNLNSFHEKAKKKSFIWVYFMLLHVIFKVFLPSCSSFFIANIYFIFGSLESTQFSAPFRLKLNFEQPLRIHANSNKITTTKKMRRKKKWCPARERKWKIVCNFCVRSLSINRLLTHSSLCGWTNGAHCEIKRTYIKGDKR